MLVSRINRPTPAKGRSTRGVASKGAILNKEKQHGSEKNGQGSQERQEVGFNQVVDKNTSENLVGRSSINAIGVGCSNANCSSAELGAGPGKVPAPLLKTAPRSTL